jgi:hypothetical protein
VSAYPDWARANLARESGDPEGDIRRLRDDVVWITVEAALAPAPLVLDPTGIRPARRRKGRR